MRQVRYRERFSPIYEGILLLLKSMWFQLGVTHSNFIAWVEFPGKKHEAMTGYRSAHCVCSVQYMYSVTYVDSVCAVCEMWAVCVRCVKCVQCVCGV